MKNPETILETERLLLRYQIPEDIDFLVGLWSNPHVTLFVGGPREKKVLEKSFRESAENPRLYPYDLWSLIEKESGMLIGHCGLLDKEIDGKTEIELNYFLAPTAWGMGFATEFALAMKTHAFEKLGLSKLVAIIEPDNSASEKVAKNIGMHMEKEILRNENTVKKLYVVNK